MMRVLEREHILASLAEYAVECRAGEGRLVLVSGEAGVGKTTLLDEFTSATPDARWIRGGCDDLSTPSPLGPLFDIAGQIGGELAAACRRGAPREELFRALIDELRPTGALTVLVIEDVQWADESTLDLLRFLGRRAQHLAALLLVTYRDDGLAPDDRLHAVLGDLAMQRSTRRAAVSPLSQQAVEVLAAGSAVTPGELYRLTGGNSFFVTEVIQAGTTEIPPSVRQAGLARVASLSAEARVAVQTAALLGAQVDPRLLDAVAAPSAIVLDEIVASGVLVSDGESLRFRHEITRVAVEQEIPAHRRRPTQAKILAALQESGSTDDARLAHHADGADDRAAVLRTAPAAARQAASLAAHREAAAQFARALRFAGGEDPAFVADLHDSYAVELSLVDRWEDAAAARETALSLWRQVGNHVREGDTLRMLSRTMWRLGRGKEAAANAQAAISTLLQQGPTAELARAYAAMAAQYMFESDLAAGLEAARAAQDLAERFGLADALSDALNTEACLHLSAGGEWEVTMRRALDVALTGGADEQAGRAYANLCGSYVDSKRFDDADDVIAEGIVYCDEHDISTFLKCLQGHRADVLTQTGQWDEAVELGMQMLRSGSSPMNRLTTLVALASIAARRGDASAWAMLDQAFDIAIGAAEPERIAWVRIARAEAYWLDGRDAEAARELEAASEVSYACSEWDRGALVSLLRRTRADLPPASGPVAAPYEFVLAGDVDAAVTLWMTYPCPYDAALALFDSGEESALREALRRFDALGAAAAVRAVRREMRRLGMRSIPVGARATTRSNPLGLTNREREVLDQLCRGLTNTEIAAALYISQKTVDHHVSSVLAKLGVPSRGAAVVEAQRLGLRPAQDRDQLEKAR